MTKPQTLQLTVTTGLSGQLSQEPSTTYTGTARDTATQLAAALLEESPSEGWTTVTCQTTPTARQRKTIVTTLENAFDAAEWEPLDSGWDGERVAVEAALSPHFARLMYEEYYFVGFWYDDKTLLLRCDALSKTPIGDSSVSVSHWHPGSMCSGSWSNTYTIFNCGLAVEHRLNDEDGYYITFTTPDTSSPAAVAAALDKTVRSWEIFGAEDRLLWAHFLDFDSGPNELLRADNEDYTIEELTVTAEPDVLIELQKLHPLPTAAEAEAWLAELDKDSDVLYDYADNPFVQRLKEIAGRTGAEGGGQ